MEAKKRVTRLSRVRQQLVRLAMQTTANQDTAAANKEYDVAILHRDYQVAIEACIRICDGVVEGKGG